MENITEVLPITNDSGKPVHFGWAKAPLFEYNPPFIGSAERRRITEADRYIVFSATHLIVFEIMDGGYLGHIGISLFSIKDHGRSSRSLDSFFSLGRFEMPHNSESGSIRIREKQLDLDFVYMKNGALGSDPEHKVMRLCRYNRYIDTIGLLCLFMLFFQKGRKQKKRLKA